VGVESIETSENVMVYPNPTANALNVKFSANQLGGTFQIYSFTGSLVQEGNITSSSMTIDVQNWEAGSYFIVSNATVGTTSKTFVVQ
jgi:hypothetical protein